MSTTEQLINTLEDTAMLLQKTQSNLRKCPKQRLTQGYIEARLKCIEDYWSTFTRAHQDLIKCTPKEARPQLSYFTKDEYHSVEELFLSMKADMKDMLINITRSGQISSEPLHNPVQEKGLSQVKLPKIELPKFSHKYEEFPTFQDLFTSMVHNNPSISKVQKLHYLKTSVTGEAESLLRHIQITENNYDQAWELLKGRYGNKRIIVTSLLKRLCNQRKNTIQSASSIKNILDTTTECLNSLNNLKVPTDSWGPLIIFLVVQKLDPESHKEWEEYAYKENTETLPTWDELKKFLQAKFRTLEMVTPNSSSHKERTTTVRERSYHTATTIDKTCFMCKEKHTLCHCKEFTKMDPSQRSHYVTSNNLCYNCLLPGHKVFKCRIPTRCHVCHKRHHSLLHEQKYDNGRQLGQSENISQPNMTAHTSVEEQEKEDTVIASNFVSKKRQQTALLATAMVTVKSSSGQTIVLRALVDPGSQAYFISEKAAQILHLERKPARGTVVGVASTKTDIKQVVEVYIAPRWSSDTTFGIQAYVMSKQLTTNIPQHTIAVGNWQHLKGLMLADPKYFQSGSVDLLLGVKEYSKIIEEQIIRGPPGTPCAQKTTLGWILFGQINTQPEESIVVMHTQVDIGEILKTIWEIDGDSERKQTKDERQCEEIYNKTHTRDANGRYIVKLPFKTENIKCQSGNTRNIAIQRLKGLERRFKRQPKLKEEYTKVIEDYINLNHAEEVPMDELNTKGVYLPHHAVLREDKETTKTRVVFDASCKGDNGVSLNDELLTGPVLQEDLRSIIMRWRMHAIAFTADIKMMYRMILLTREDVDFQRFLWRKDDEAELKDYRLLTVTFGTAAAPYLAVRTLRQLALDEAEKYPLAAKVALTDYYVDDVLTGNDTVAEGVEVMKQLKKMMQQGGFELKKWSSNSIEFITAVDPQDRSSNATVDLNVDGTVKALGISWNLGTDQLEYKLNLAVSGSTVTKRSILSDVQKLFDPLGWIAPSVVMAKMLIQELWQEKLDWDDAVSPLLSEKWKEIRSDLEGVNCIKLNRWLQTKDAERDNVQLHGFCDASQRAYGAVVYVRVMNKEVITTEIIAARTKVAPLRAISLPKLELCGAVLLSKLLTHVSKAMRIQPSQVFAWTDSSIVLSWLLGDPNKWKTFIANRVVEITDKMDKDRWFHVQSQDNPAHIASRGMLLSELTQCNIWWRGPQWLRNEKINFTRPNDIYTDLEAKKEKIEANLKIDIQEEKHLITQFEDFDDLKELTTTIAYCIRFLTFKKKFNTDKILTTKDMDDALQRCIQLVQREEFSDEINSLKNKSQLKKRSSLKSLTPYLDESNILRVGGRLRNADLSHDGKHPIILGHKNKLTYLVVADAHKQTLHGGVQLMMSYLRSKYWIIRAKSLVKMNIHRCMVCARHNATAQKQLMGQLPKPRVTPARPFVNSGVDFAGPLQVVWSRARGAKTSKAYIAIFICLSTKAIHLELVGDLTSEAFIGAFRRFTARRGKCSNLWSDQGRNFVGANKELEQQWKEAILDFSSQILNKLVYEGTQWHFIPAYSPNFGGLWEVGVKSIKHHLRRVLTTNLTFEETSTVLCQIEACLNSRPLSPIDDTDVDDLNPLTPGHFLIGEAPVMVPSANVENVKISNLSRWHYLQRIMTDFWRKWQEEYLTRLQQRPKWLKSEKEFEKGNLVLIKVENLPPAKWALGRIIDKHPGQDGLTRVYSVKSGDSIIKRCVTKLCALPVDTE